MENVWMTRRVLCFAHQGGAHEGPSSTLFAIEQALAQGATAIELDVHQSADGVLFVCHDATIDRTSDAIGAIAEHSAAELAEVDNAYWFVPGRGAERGHASSEYPFRGRAPSDERFRLAMLASVLEAHPGVPLNLDIKRTEPEVVPYEAEVAAMLGRYSRTNDVIVTSFSDHATRRFHDAAPDIGTAPGASALTMIVQSIRAGESVPHEVLEGHVALQVPSSIAGVRLIDDRLVGAAHELGLAVHVWTVDDEQEMDQLVELGVDGIMTDVPSVLATVLRRTGTTARVN